MPSGMSVSLPSRTGLRSGLEGSNVSDVSPFMGGVASIKCGQIGQQLLPVKTIRSTGGARGPVVAHHDVGFVANHAQPCPSQHFGAHPR